MSDKLDRFLELVHARLVEYGRCGEVEFKDIGSKESKTVEVVINNSYTIVAASSIAEMAAQHLDNHIGQRVKFGVHPVDVRRSKDIGINTYDLTSVNWIE